MCGIAGVAFADSGRLPDLELLERMTAAVRHRGPDGDGVYQGPGAGLGVRRLAIVAPTNGAQPIASEDGTVVVVCNGEIYNFVELRRELEMRGHRFATGSDVEVIVHLYEDHGTACLERLRGMFAFALWDVGRRRLMLARDRLGIKPLFYASTGSALWFGSEQKCLLVTGETSRDVDATAVRDLFVLGFVRGPRTLFDSIQSLPPAHYLLYSEGSVSRHRYWHVRFPAKGDDSPRRSAGEWAEALRAKLTECVQLHLRSDVPVGAWLSGGLDSSAVAALMSTLTRQPVRTFSIAFDYPELDEFGGQRTLDAFPEFQLSGERVRCGPETMSYMPSAVWHDETPAPGSVTILRMILSELSSRGTKVVLTGEGADEVLGGYPWYRTQRLLGALAWLPRSAHHLARLPPIRRRWPRAGRLIADPPGPSVAGYRALLSPRTDAAMMPVWSADLRSRIPDAAAAERESWRPDGFHEWHPFSQLQWYDLTVRLPDVVVAQVDRGSMAYGLEARVPFLDHELVELCASIPVRLKFRALREKYVLRRAMETILPREIAWRRKRGLKAPTVHWLRGSLPDFARHMFEASVVRSKGYFEPATVAAWLAEQRGGNNARTPALTAVLAVHLWDELLRSGRPLAAVNTPVSFGR